jgi:hypothetical protein
MSLAKEIKDTINRVSNEWKVCRTPKIETEEADLSGKVSVLTITVIVRKRERKRPEKRQVILPAKRDACL